MMPPEYKVALIGAGLIGEKRLKALPVGSVRVVCDLDLARAKLLASLAPGCRACNDPMQAVTDPDVDVVMIATVNTSLAPLAMAALEASKHVLLEKPAGVSVAEIDRLQELAKQKGRRVRVGYNHRYHPAALKMMSIWNSGICGPLMFLRARYGHGGRVGYDREWRADPALSGGGELMDQGVHLIDLAGLLLKDFSSVEGHCATFFWDMPVDDNAFLNLRDSTGATAWLHASCTEWKNLFSFEVYGKQAKLHWEGLGGSYGVEKLTHYQMLPEMGPPETVIYEFPRADQSWKLEMDDFFEDIQLQREPVPGLVEARGVLEVVEFLYHRFNPKDR
ncbi:Gfo/Idh/MocA family oxidoreductase [soil metagenome]